MSDYVAICLINSNFKVNYQMNWLDMLLNISGSALKFERFLVGL